MPTRNKATTTRATTRVAPTPNKKTVGAGFTPARMPPQTAVNAQTSSSPKASIGDPSSKIADQLENEARAAQDAMVNQVRSLLDDVASMDEFANRIPELLGSMDTQAMTDIIAKAFTTADLTGQYEVNNGG